MVCQLRIYDIKQGQMADWLKLFEEKVAPLHRKFDIPVRQTWVDHEHSQFIWVREFVGVGTREEQETRYTSSEERAKVIGDEPKRFIEKMEIRVIEPVLESVRPGSTER